METNTILLLCIVILVIWILISNNCSKNSTERFSAEQVQPLSNDEIQEIRILLNTVKQLPQETKDMLVKIGIH